MNDKIDTAAIVRVWERVAPEDAGESPQEELITAIRAFMDTAWRARQMYELLALKTRGTRESRELSELARQEADTARRLQTEHFLLTGDTYAPAKAHPSAPYLMASLRQSHEGEQENARKYAAAAARLPEGKLRETLYDLSARERKHAGKIRSIIERTLR